MIIQSDTHVHLHDAYDVDEFFTFALSNMRRFAPNGADDHLLRILCMTDVEGASTQDRLCREVKQTTHWRFTMSDSQRHIHADHTSGERLYILPGRQIVSKENLEILALGYNPAETDKVFAMSELISKVVEAGALPVLPWGPGKWIGARGALVEQLLETHPEIVLSDNGNRLCFGAEPELLVRAKEKGMPVIAGSDPLPIYSTRKRVGMYGSCWDVEASDTVDVAKILQQLQGKADQIRTFGRLETPFNFVKNQFAMQVRKRMKKKTS